MCRDSTRGHANGGQRPQSDRNFSRNCQASGMPPWPINLLSAYRCVYAKKKTLFTVNRWRRGHRFGYQSGPQWNSGLDQIPATMYDQPNLSDIGSSLTWWLMVVVGSMGCLGDVNSCSPRPHRPCALVTYASSNSADCSMGIPWNSLSAHGVPTECPWRAHGVPMGSPWAQ